MIIKRILDYCRNYHFSFLRAISKKEKIVVIMNEMSEYLSISQMKKLQEVMLKVFAEKSEEKRSIPNDEYLKMFLAAKRIEGCSERTIQYYEVTIAKMLGKVTIPIRRITTEDMRAYLSDYQKINDCSKVTVDNVRRNISSFFFMVGRGKLYIKESYAAYT